ncbi:M20/M25/M40 family metallo-hydrolase [Bacillus sp. V33-4]|uniref:M20/M25/M40 family metallo-hydrolase n=1 Tax=Bacillus sp. V33-4 TaxID=2054169 RepID=UPI000C7757C8|nr:M20/M25/M40 family metallo-hydrolase [Bacillus sp. V33-4]PLR80869.1 peptidase M20 [Bacillus sp. V33-4]
MFHILQALSTEQQVEVLTRRLIQLLSYNGTIGETEKADFLKEIICSFPYFKENESFVWEQPISNDPLGRKNIFALVRGQSECSKTVLYHAHVDTVGIEDFGALHDIAHDPDVLEEFFKSYSADAEVQADAGSGNWMFGRGALDMQSGIAVHLVNLLHFSEQRDQLPGNLLVLFNPDEESQHVGIRAALTELTRLETEQNLDFIAAINNDFISPLHSGDQTRYVYTGAAGKLLPCFSIFGREAHVGDSLSAIDPTLIAAELNLAINANLDLTEYFQNELTLPPSCLYLKDDKQIYDVQTAVSCGIYFNHFIYEKSPKEILTQLVDVVENRCETLEKKLAQTYTEHRKRNGLPEREISWDIEVITFGEYVEKLEEMNLHPLKAVEAALEHFSEKDLDERMLAFKIVEALHQLDPEKNPRVILFFAPPFLPANRLPVESNKGQSLLATIEAVLDEVHQETKETFELRKYFPYLADGSFLSFNGTEEDISSIENNFPAMHKLFALPLGDMKALNIPSINLGVYGKSGHKWTERVYKPYTFKILPHLIRKMTKRLLE